MDKPLYLLRQHPDRISSSLFRVSDVEMDVVFIEQVLLIASSTVKGIVVADEGMAVGCSLPTMTYDELVEKIFSTEHIIVL